MKKMLIQLTGGETYMSHCDRLPHGSIHKVEVLENGVIKIQDKTQFVNEGFPFKELNEMPETKECPLCKNIFPSTQPFIQNRPDNKLQSCVRCYERVNIVNREEYRAILFEEFKLIQKEKQDVD